MFYATHTSFWKSAALALKTLSMMTTMQTLFTSKHISEASCKLAVMTQALEINFQSYDHVSQKLSCAF